MITMTGPEHKAEAERLLTDAAEVGPSRRASEGMWLLKQAEVHARLATLPPAAAAPAAAAKPA